MDKSLLIIGGIVAAATGAIVGTILITNKKTQEAIKTVKEAANTSDETEKENKDDLEKKVADIQAAVDAIAKSVEETNTIAKKVDSAMPDIATASQVYLSLYFENRRAAGLGPMAAQPGPQVTITPPNPQPQQPTQTNATQVVGDQQFKGMPNPAADPNFNPSQRTGMFANLSYENGIIPGAQVDGLGNIVTD